MQTLRTPAQEAAEDIFFGQLAIIVARWFLIAGATVLVVWTLSDPGQLAVAIVPVAALMAMNFFIHGRYLMEQPANQLLVTITSFLDLVLITILILIWPGSLRGLASPFFVFYYPAVLAFGFVVERRLEIGYTVLAIVLYAGVCLFTTPQLLADTGDTKALMLRLITLGACGGLANYYWRIQRSRRRAAAGQVPAAGVQPSAGAR